jgi:hypothetical protein
MQRFNKCTFSYLAGFSLLVLTTFFMFNGCDDAGVETEDPVVSHVEHFDSIGVDETNGNNSCGINLFNGTTVLRDSSSKDCQLVDSASTGINFMLRSGDLSDFNLPAGFQMRFNRIYASMTMENFDTITVLPVGRDTILPDLDFTADDTYGSGAWGYFNEPMSLSDSKPVYSFWLKQKSSEFHGKNIYGILIPREATDSSPGINNVGGYRMSFEVRINTNGENDFHHAAH